MSSVGITLRLRGLSWSAAARDIRAFFAGISIPDGGVHIIGGDNGEAFITFNNDSDFHAAMQRNGGVIHNSPVSLTLSSKDEMNYIIKCVRNNASIPDPSLSKSSYGAVSGESTSPEKLMSGGNRIDDSREAMHGVKHSSAYDDNNATRTRLHADSHFGLATDNFIQQWSSSGSSVKQRESIVRAHDKESITHQQNVQEVYSTLIDDNSGQQLKLNRDNNMWNTEDHLRSTQHHPNVTPRESSVMHFQSELRGKQTTMVDLQPPRLEKPDRQFDVGVVPYSMNAPPMHSQQKWDTPMSDANDRQHWQGPGATKSYKNIDPVPWHQSPSHLGSSHSSNQGGHIPEAKSLIQGGLPPLQIQNNQHNSAINVRENITQGHDCDIYDNDGEGDIPFLDEKRVSGSIMGSLPGLLPNKPFMNRHEIAQENQQRKPQSGAAEWPVGDAEWPIGDDRRQLQGFHPTMVRSGSDTPMLKAWSGGAPQYHHGLPVDPSARIKMPIKHDVRPLIDFHPRPRAPPPPPSDTNTALFIIRDLPIGVPPHDLRNVLSKHNIRPSEVHIRPNRFEPAKDMVAFLKVNSPQEISTLLAVSSLPFGKGTIRIKQCQDATWQLEVVEKGGLTLKPSKTPSLQSQPPTKFQPPFQSQPPMHPQPPIPPQLPIHGQPHMHGQSQIHTNTEPIHGQPAMYRNGQPPMQSQQSMQRHPQMLGQPPMQGQQPLPMQGQPSLPMQAGQPSLLIQGQPPLQMQGQPVMPFDRGPPAAKGLLPTPSLNQALSNDPEQRPHSDINIIMGSQQIPQAVRPPLNRELPYHMNKPQTVDVCQMAPDPRLQHDIDVRLNRNNSSADLIPGTKLPSHPHPKSLSEEFDRDTFSKRGDKNRHEILEGPESRYPQHDVVKGLESMGTRHDIPSGQESRYPQHDIAKGQESRFLRHDILKDQETQHPRDGAPKTVMKCVAITNLPQNIHEAELEYMYRGLRIVPNGIYIERDRSGYLQKGGFVFIEFASEEEQCDALLKDGLTVEGVPVYMKSISREEALLRIQEHKDASMDRDRHSNGNEFHKQCKNRKLDREEKSLLNDAREEKIRSYILLTNLSSKTTKKSLCGGIEPLHSVSLHDIIVESDDHGRCLGLAYVRNLGEIQSDNLLRKNNSSFMGRTIRIERVTDRELTVKLEKISRRRHSRSPARRSSPRVHQHSRKKTNSPSSSRTRSPKRARLSPKIKTRSPISGAMNTKCSVSMEDASCGFVRISRFPEPITDESLRKHLKCNSILDVSIHTEAKHGRCAWIKLKSPAIAKEIRKEFHRTIVENNKIFVDIMYPRETAGKFSAKSHSNGSNNTTLSTEKLDKQPKAPSDTQDNVPVETQEIVLGETQENKPQAPADKEAMVLGDTQEKISGDIQDMVQVSSTSTGNDVVKLQTNKNKDEIPAKNISMQIHPDPSISFLAKPVQHANTDKKGDEKCILVAKNLPKDADEKKLKGIFYHVRAASKCLFIPTSEKDKQNLYMVFNSDEQATNVLSLNGRIFMRVKLDLARVSAYEFEEAERVSKLVSKSLEAPTHNSVVGKPPGSLKPTAKEEFTKGAFVQISNVPITYSPAQVIGMAGPGVKSETLKLAFKDSCLHMVIGYESADAASASLEKLLVEITDAEKLKLEQVRVGVLPSSAV